MKSSHVNTTLQAMLARAGIRINGKAPHDIRIHNPLFYERVLAGGSLALGESYMDGWWDCDALDRFFDRILSARLDQHRLPANLRRVWDLLKARLGNAQRHSKAYEIGRRHYDIGNRLFGVMLDKRMNYSCGYWPTATSLDEAREAKLDLICRKLGLKPGITLLDIGCGWGGLARYASRIYGARVTGITVSRQQMAYARKYCQDYDVTIQFRDYRELNGIYDRIVSVACLNMWGFTTIGIICASCASV